MTLSDLRIALPRIADRPAALYFTLTNPADAAATQLVAVLVDGATRAEMHETTGGTMKPLKAVDLPPGTTLMFSPGAKHVMVYGVPGTWKPGDRPEVTLRFADGSKVSARAKVQTPQAATAEDGMSQEADAMPGMKM